MTTIPVSTPHPGRILGIDPGLNITGYGMIEPGTDGLVLIEAGVIRSRASDALPVRLAELFDGLRQVIASLSPESMGLEELYSHYKRPRTAILMGHARGVLCLAAGMAGVPVVSYAATQVKKTLTGAGRAPKGQMQHAIQRELRLATLPEPADVADALAIALCHHYSQSRQGLVPSP